MCMNREFSILRILRIISAPVKPPRAPPDGAAAPEATTPTPLPARVVPRGLRAFDAREDFEDWRERSTTFAALAAFTTQEYRLTERGEPREVQAIRVTSDLHAVFGLAPALGRMLQNSDFPTVPFNPVALIRFKSAWIVPPAMATLPGRDFTAALTLRGSTSASKSTSAGLSKRNARRFK